MMYGVLGFFFFKLIKVGSMAHEMGHVIGFWHEQARPDRDEYVYIDFNNVKPGFEQAFKKYDWDQVLTHAIPYDVGSIMHYGAYVSILSGDLVIKSRR